MSEPSGRSSGKLLGCLSVVVGVLFLGLGAGYVVDGQRTEGLDGLLFGGSAVAAGWVILNRRR